jgi:BirA family biotin operon repressor/biotin-[acetyl-CoA-carboxylase] ligase
LTASFVVRPGEVAKERLGWVPLVAGLAVVRALTGLGVSCHLKWPNDVMVEDPEHHPLPSWGTSRKIAGILCEAVGDAVVIGIGLNVSQDAADIPVVHGISLALLGSPHLDREELLGAIATELASLCDVWGRDGGQMAISAAVTHMCGTIGEEVTVDRPGAPTLVGLAAGLSIEGGLLVESASGRVETVLAGDVSLRTSATSECDANHGDG